MNFKLFIDKEKEEQVLVYTHEKSELTDAIEKLVCQSITELNGYKDREIIRLELPEIYCFIVEENKVFALTDKDKLHIKYRLYQLEKAFGNSFVKINQSCLVCISKIERFDATLSGALKVKMKNGYSDYVSRRNVKAVKERLGL